MLSFLDRIAGAPISWGVCEVPGWGLELPPERVLSEMQELGLVATELGSDGYLPADPDDLSALCGRYGLTMIGGFVPLVLHDPAQRGQTLAAARRAAQLMGGAGGTEFIMGSVAANRLLPGGPGQEPHVDYPYWDMYKRNEFPMNINSSFPLNAQATILLDPFTPDSGATAFLPNSQGDLRYPDEHDRGHFFDNAARMTGDPGDCVIFNGMCWHCAMPNVSDDVDRTGVLIEYLPKFVAPLEDLRRGVRPDVVERATPMLRQLMALEYPYPEILDDNTGEATIGRDVEAESHSAIEA